MAMTECRECKKQISDQAKACPHCGVANPGQSGGTSAFTIAVALFIVAAIGFSMSSSKPTPSPRPAASTPAELDDMARYGCSEFFKQSAHDPASLEWIEQPTWAVRQLPDGMRDVDMQMRGKNKFGALILTSKTCRVRQFDGKVQLVSFRD